MEEKDDSSLPGTEGKNVITAKTQRAQRMAGTEELSFVFSGKPQKKQKTPSLGEVENLFRAAGQRVFRNWSLSISEKIFVLCDLCAFAVKKGSRL